MTALNQPYNASIIGAGSWGRALAHSLSNNEKKVLIYARDKKKSKDSLSGSNISITDEITEVFSLNKPLIISTPVASLNDIGKLLKKHNFLLPILLTCKGIDPNSGLFPAEIISNYVDKDNLVILSGPSFASEVIQDKPTAVTIASPNKEARKIFTKLFHQKYFRIYESTDILGCQLGGAMKNILSVAVGISDGLSLGANARAALITRGIVEIKNVGKALRCDDQTISGLSGFGDLVLTANDNQSRNRRFGLEIASGTRVNEAEKKIGQVVEGINASIGLQILIKKHNLNLPICSKVFDIITGVIDPKTAVDELLVRVQKEEFDQ
tara:strand:- start:1405 stop:2379 length:975 start_codon:yes stop_codon:yes gene_type:complete